VSELTQRTATGGEGLAQGPYVAARAGFEPATFRPIGLQPGYPNELTIFDSGSTE